MRYFIPFTLLFVAFTLANTITAQVTVTASVGLPVGNYTTLKSGFDAINAGSHAGSISISITANTAETAPAVLNGSGVGAASYTSITIGPSGGVARTISGAITAGFPLIDLNGADNVTINGLNTGGNSLSISNTTVSAVPGTSTIRLQGDATSNSIIACTVLGSSTMAAGIDGGTIWFGSAAISTGNDNNTISNCDIGPAGANLPSKGIYFSGSSNIHPGTGNSGNTITGNRIFDYFSATVSSAGIDLNSGTVNGTISNNKFYQSSPRTQTATGIWHRAISINNTGGADYTISGNTIGYSNAAASGVYAIVFPATVSNSFYPIYVSVGGTTLTKTEILSNTIASISVSGGASGVGDATPFSCIYEHEGATESRLNNIGSQVSTGNITYTSSSSLASDVNGIYSTLPGGWFTWENTMGGITVGNSGAGITNFRGVHANISAAHGFTSNLNTIGGTVANSIQNTCTATGCVTVGIHSPAAVIYMAANTVRNITVSGGTGSGAAAGLTGVLVTITSLFNFDQPLNGSQIHDLRSTAVGAATVNGIYINGGVGLLVESNLIYDLDAANASSQINGVVVVAGTNRYFNNMIRLGALDNSATLGLGVSGFLESGGTNTFSHNSVFIGGAPNSGAVSTFALRSTTTTVTRSYRNNIFVNARSNAGATGKHYAIQVGGTGINPAGLNCNYNILRVTGAGGLLGLFNGTDHASLGAWRTATGQDLNSLDLDPNFVGRLAVPADLHLNSPTPAEGTGTFVNPPLADFDGTPRSTSTPTDIGADAGNFVVTDLIPPSISYTPLGNTCVTGSRTLVASITDASGVPVSGNGRPRLYWRVNAAVWQQVGGTFTSGSFQFQFGSGASIGDVVSYYIVARDNAPIPNIGAFPSAGASGFTYDPPAAATPPSAPNSYTVWSTLNGLYTVGASGTYATIGAAVSAYNTSCLAGPVIFQLTDALYAEGPLTINANPDASPTNTLTIRPAPGASPSIVCNCPSAVFVLNGADHVTIEGSNAPVANSCCPSVRSARHMTISNTSTIPATAVIWLQTATGLNGATGNVVRNCIINGQYSTVIGLGSGGTTITTLSNGFGNNGNTFENNAISNVGNGIYSMGFSAAAKNQGNAINLNVLVTGIATKGILTGFEDQLTVSCNTVDNIVRQSTSDVVGICVGYQSSGISSTSPGINEVTNATITNNVIGVVRHTGTASAAGIAYGASNSGSTLIANNMISGVMANGTNGNIAAGIVLGGGAGGTVNVLHNTVSMSGTIIGGLAATQTSACLALTGSPMGTLNLLNNIFSNTQQGNTGATLRLACVALSSTTFATFTSNNNDLYSEGPAPGTHVTGMTGGVVTGISRTSLAEWQLATGQDAGATDVEPMFLSESDLHLDDMAPVNIGNLMTGGAPSSIVLDVDCEPRSMSSPSIGADEFTTTGCLSTPVGGTSLGIVAPVCAGTTTLLTNSGASSGEGIVYQWKVSEVNGGPYQDVVGGTGANSTEYTTPALIEGSHFYVLAVTCVNIGSTTLSNEVMILVDPIPDAFATLNGSACTGGDLVLNGSTTSVGSYVWSGPGGFNSAVLSPVLTNLSSAQNGVYTFTVSLGFCSSSSSASVQVMVNPDPVLTSTTAVPAVVCQGGASQLNVSVMPGYEMSEDNKPFIDIRATGTSVGVLADNSEHTIPIPLFSFNGTGYTLCRVGNNGALVFGSLSGDIDQANATLPAGSFGTAGTIGLAPFWDDLFPAAGASITYQQVDDRFIIQWTDQAHAISPNGGRITFQVQLDLNSSSVYFIYDDMVFLGQAAFDNGGSATVGVNLSATQGIEYSFQRQSLVNGQCIRFSPSWSTYAWSPAVYLNSTAIADPLAMGIQANVDYTVSVTAGSGCSSTGTVGVVVSPAPVIMSLSASPAAVCAGGSSQLQVLANGAVEHCSGVSYSLGCGTGDMITQVTFAGISRSSACDAPTGYSLQTAQQASVVAGGTYSFTMATGPAYQQGGAAWVDWDQDGLFEPAELLVSGFTGASGASYTNGSYSVPLTARNGRTRLRVRCTYYANPVNNPCGQVDWGEVEDYYVNVTGGQAGLTYAWSPASDLDNVSVSDPVASNIQPVSTYTVVVSDPQGCTASASVNIGADPTDTDGDGVPDCTDDCPFVSGQVGGPCNDGDPATINDMLDANCNCVGSPSVPLLLNASVILDGAYDAGSGLMRDNLRSVPAFPLTHPYGGLPFGHAGFESVVPLVLSYTGVNAIVDWVLVELRDNSDPSIVVGSAAGFVQRDGDIVASNGLSLLQFTGVAPGPYRIAVRHRNHLGVMTLDAVPMSGSPAFADFTQPGLTTYGTNARKTTVDGKLALWPGNVNPDNLVKYLGAGDDRDPVLGAIGGVVLTTVLPNVYHQADVTMNGEVKYLGAGDDRDPILSTIGGVILNSVRVEQLP